MTHAATDRRRNGARLAAGAGWLLCARLLAFVALLVLALPPSAACAAPHAPHAPAFGMSADAAPSEGPAAADPHHCAQCACHTAMAAEPHPVSGTARTGEIRFAVLARATCGRATAPPHKPPRV